MVLCTIIELYNEEDSINHHGFSRKVFSGKSRQMVDIDKITINERISSAAKIIGKYLIWKVPAFLKAKSNYPNQQTGFLTNRVDGVVMDSCCNGQLVVQAFIVILLLS